MPPDGYPIAGFTWVFIYKEQNYNGRSKDRATKLLKLLWWNIHEGQTFTEPLNYAPLSKEALKSRRENFEISYLRRENNFIMISY